MESPWVELEPSLKRPQRSFLPFLPFEETAVCKQENGQKD